VVALLGGCPADVCDTPVALPAAPGTLLDMARVSLACGIALAVTALLLTAALALRRDARPLWRRRGFALPLLAVMLGALAVAAVAWQASRHFAALGLPPRAITFAFDHGALRDLFRLAGILRVATDATVAITVILVLAGAQQLVTVYRRPRHATKPAVPS
jgi:hypothetical protein